jgi:AraC-like DNA-binding protein
LRIVLENEPSLRGKGPRVRQGFATPMPQSDPHRPGLPTASGGLARLAAQEASAAGLDLGPLLKTSGLTAAQIDDADERLSAKAQIAFVDAVARALGRDRLGFELAREFDLRQIGLLYYVAASSETLVEAVQRIERFSAVGNEAVVFRCSKGADLEIRLDYSGVARHSDRHQIEFFLAALVRVCRSLVGVSLVPLRVTIAHARSEGLSEYNRFFGCRTEFAAPYDAIAFRDDCRRLPVVSADPHLSDILGRYCEETLASRKQTRGSFRVRVENAIAPLLPHGKPQASVVARKLNLSPRTLARRLADEGLSFAAVLEAMRRELALRYLEDAKLSISQVAWLLGFQEAGAFTHAFRRWAGQTPSEMRRSELLRDRIVPRSRSAIGPHRTGASGERGRSV